ncbi:hypothetical protein F2P81_016859 [Scophthalmus maximus]|uniref:Uncharacterized protein n=1 Tax=Scophthalmus maximus TaxID=52904 RepID=A0A6A4SCX8_SCOMX|nr:hypothetical protein F2P81_016859 [Scophthalmus maximus]
MQVSSCTTGGSRRHPFLVVTGPLKKKKSVVTKITGVSSSWQVAFARAAQRCNAAVPTVNKMCCKYVILLIIYIGNNYSPETQAAVCEDRRHKSVTG